jgi:hypothetical protein
MTGAEGCEERTGLTRMHYNREKRGSVIAFRAN